MNLLLGTKQDAENHFGAKSIMGTTFLGKITQGEKAYKFTSSGLSEGYETTIGLFNGKVRYVVFKKKSSSKWNEGDCRSCLSHIAAYRLWISNPGSDYFDLAENPENKSEISASGWFSPKKKYAFVYVPYVQGDVSIMPDRGALDPKI